MEFTNTKIKEVKLIKPKIHGDSRGFFLETYQKNHFKDAGISCDFIQDNHSRSKKNINISGFLFARFFDLLLTTSSHLVEIQ